jgi:hypothetical protein
MRTVLLSCVLFSSAMLAARPAEACSPASAQIIATSPGDGATAVPTDATIRVFFGDGYAEFGSSPEATVMVDGSAVPVTIDAWARATSMVEQQGLLTITPASPLPVGAAVSVEVPHSKSGPVTFNFTIGEGAATVAADAPTLVMDRLEHFTIDPNQKSSCDDAAWWEVDWSVSPGTADPDGLSIVEIYKVTPDWDGTLEAPFRIIGPAGVDNSEALDSRYRVDLSAGADPTEECFVAVVRDGAGNASPPSAMSCGEADEDTGDPGVDTGDESDEDEKESGCSAVPLAASVWGVLLALGASVSRRRW